MVTGCRSREVVTLEEPDFVSVGGQHLGRLAGHYVKGRTGRRELSCSIGISP